MKKKIVILTMLILCISLLAGCQCKHDWAEATCTTPKTCSKCGETEGEALGHTWQEAACETPKLCLVCGETEGKAWGHTWQDATCETPKTCLFCGKTEGDALGHNWQEASCETAKTCLTCGATEGEAAGHVFGTWSALDSKTMERSCMNCDYSEQQTLDRETMFLEQILGSWVGTDIWDDSESDWKPIEDEEYILTFADDHTFSLLYSDGETYSGEWTYKEYKEKTSEAYYSFTGYISDLDETINFAKYEMEDGEPVTYLNQEWGEEYISFEKNADAEVSGTAAAPAAEDTDALTAILPGTWEAYCYTVQDEIQEDFTAATLEFSEDGSVVFTLGEDTYSGTWTPSLDAIEWPEGWTSMPAIYELSIELDEFGTYSLWYYGSHEVLDLYELYDSSDFTSFNKISD